MNGFSISWKDAKGLSMGAQLRAKDAAHAIVLANQKFLIKEIMSVVSLREECAGCEDEKCQDCCPHEEHDHFICLSCEKEMDPSAFGNEDYGQDR